VPIPAREKVRVRAGVAAGGRTSETDRGELIVIAWLAGVLLLFSAAASRMEHYSIPALPPMALLIAKLFRDYARQAFEDTLTLYLHGTCCDIDVETGPRQMPSRYLRKRLELLFSLYPPPEGYAVFPEQLKKR